MVILLLTAAVAALAVLLGLSEKPQVEAIGVAITADEAAAFDDEAAALASATNPLDVTSDNAATDPSNDGAGAATSDDAMVDDEATTGDAATGETVAQGESALPTPEPTPEIAAAVESIPSFDEPEDGAATEQAVDLVPVEIRPGRIDGTFFTKHDEDEGAIIERNELTIDLAADGSGTFAGVLDMTLADGTDIALAMSGPILWTNTNPNIEMVVNGTYTLVGPNESDNVTSDTADLKVSSLVSGSGSLCTPRCFGLSFPPQTGF